ncbi:hypothetical protein ACHAWU_004192 [Discostella pseudostelligera]|uniref:Uncharacterized protein n=1 Tax=Discostella pseudostelligera TaxID=259834 RepID=A0ABD3M5U6_9STRA
MSRDRTQFLFHTDDCTAASFRIWDGFGFGSRLVRTSRVSSMTWHPWDASNPFLSAFDQISFAFPSGLSVSGVSVFSLSLSGAVAVNEKDSRMERGGLMSMVLSADVSFVDSNFLRKDEEFVDEVVPVDGAICAIILTYSTISFATVSTFDSSWTLPGSNSIIIERVHFRMSTFTFLVTFS